MAKAKGKDGNSGEVVHFRHSEEKRPNIPTSAVAGRTLVPKAPKKKYFYNPHLPPVLRHDPAGKADRVLALVEKAGKEPLSAEEVKVLEEALRNHRPWLEWTGKREAEEKGFFEVDPVALSIHERVSPQAIIRSAKREDVQRELFADPQEPWTEAVKYYRHDVDWANRLILGDSLQVMTSLAEREGLAGKVQMIYIDPPYGIKYGSNFQPMIASKNVKDNDDNMSRETEMIKAYRDTWELGVHSYIEYLRNRIVASKNLLTESGSLFIQISDENFHRVKTILDEVFGEENFISQITFRTKIPLGATYLAGISDYLIFYAKDIKKLKFRRLFQSRDSGFDTLFSQIEEKNGHRHAIKGSEDVEKHSKDSVIFRGIDFVSSGRTESCVFDAELNGKIYRTNSGKSWKTNKEGFGRLKLTERILPGDNSLSYQFKHSDYPVQEYTNLWSDTQGATEKEYVVQTATKVIERCLLMTTDPGDLVLDPTCGSGTTAYVAEQWGRRWITIDTSRVALAIARQRLMTARFESYRVRKPSGGTAENPGTGFVYETVPHITLKSIAQNRNLDPIFEKHEPVLDSCLAACNKALAEAGPDLKRKLEAKLEAKRKAEGKKAVTDADERRWLLKDKWEHWEVPFDTDPDWPEALRKAVEAYRKAWRAKMDEVNACIAANADREELVDRPETQPGVRVSGPFTVEGVLPAEISSEEAEASLDDEVAEAEPAYGETAEAEDDAGRNAEAYYDQMLRLLKLDGVTFKGNKIRKFAKLLPLWSEGRDLPWQAEGWWEGEDEASPASVALVFGPQYGPLTAMRLEEAMQKAPRAGYAELVAAAFSFEPEAVEIVADEASHAKLLIHQAYIRPDVNPGMEGLLKDQPKSQLFTVFGRPEIEVKAAKDGSHIVRLEGVDVYDPLTGNIVSTGAEKVAAWFVDSDYDGRCFCVTQAFFPDQDAWEKIRKALKTQAEDYAFDAYKGTVSVPFKAGKYKRIAVKVIDPRGNEVMIVKKLEA